MIVEAPSFVPPFAGNSARHLDLQIEDPTARPDWDERLAAHAGAGFFHTSSWAKTLSAAYGFRCCYVTASDGDRLVGLLPLIEASSWLRGRRGVCLPFTDECPPLTSGQVTPSSLFAAAQAEGIRRGWKYVELRGSQQSFADLPQSVSFYTHVLPLTSSHDELFENCDSAVRRAIRKAERGNVSVRFGNDLDSVRAYYRLHCRTRSKHGAPPQPFRFFEALHEHALQAGRGFVALAIHNQHPIAGALFLQFGRRSIYKFSASDERFQDLRGANLVIWRSIQKLAASGIKELNFGKTSLSNHGLQRFKRGWGSEERMLRYVRYSFAQQDFVSVRDLAAGVQRRIFALLPVSFSRCIGRALYGHMS